MDPVKLLFSPKPVLGLIGERMFTLLAFGLKYSCVCLSLPASIQTESTAVTRHLPTHRCGQEEREKALNKAETQGVKNLPLRLRSGLTFAFSS